MCDQQNILTRHDRLRAEVRRKRKRHKHATEGSIDSQSARGTLVPDLRSYDANRQEHDLIFTNTIGKPIDPTTLRRSHYRLLELAGLPRVTFHALRHSAISFMANENVAGVNMRKRAGHKTEEMTEHYSHSLNEKDVQTAQLMDKILFDGDNDLTAPKLHPNS